MYLYTYENQYHVRSIRQAKETFIKLGYETKMKELKRLLINKSHETRKSKEGGC